VGDNLIFIQVNLTRKFNQGKNWSLEIQF